MSLLNHNLIYPMFAHVVLCGALYTLLTVARAPTAWGIGVNKDGTNPWQQVEPKISANLSNQFEWPLFFYVICLLLLFNGKEIDPVYLWLAWLFILGRIVHSLVHILTSNIRVRGAVFTINFLAVFVMWVLFIFQY